MTRVLILFLSLVILPVASAQEYRGTILGRISDSSGGVVPGAAVTVTDQSTRVAQKAASNPEGNYQVPFLLPGTYTITVEHPGFKKVVRPGIAISINEKLALDFVLEVGATTETITVTETAPLLATSSADLGQVVERRYMDLLPMGSRNVVNLSRLAPGVTGDTGSYTSNAQSNFSISGGGSTRGRNEIMVDGIPNTIPRTGGLIVYVPAADAVQEMKVHTTLFDASYGHSNGGAVNITTRSGTNRLHGTLYDFKRWRALNANSWTNNRLGLPRNPVNYNLWGATVGGPVVLPKLYNGRNKTFFSFAYESDLDSRSLTRQARVPTQLERSGDFSQTLNRLGGALTIYDPFSTAVSGNTVTRQPFAGARLPAARVSPIGAAIAGAYPLPNLPGPAQVGRYNWFGSGVYRVRQEQVSLRMDHSLSDRQRMFGRFSLLTRTQRPDALFPGLYATPTAASTDSSSDLNIDTRHFRSVVLDDTYTFSPSLLGSIRYGFSRRLGTNTYDGTGKDPAVFKLPEVFLRNQRTKGFPIFRIGGSGNTHEGFPAIGSDSTAEANDVHAFLATFTKLLSNHSIKFGVDYRLTRWNRLSQGTGQVGEFTFTAAFTQADPFTTSSADRTGTALASALLAIPNSGTFGYNSPLSLQNHYLAGFVQEDWKVSRRLTLNFGLRYELETPYTERYNRVSYGFDRNAVVPVEAPGMQLRGGLLFAGVEGRPRPEGRVDRNNFGPRFGFAYSVTNRTVVRGGYGLFFSAQSYNSDFLGQVAAFNANTPYVGTTDNGATPFTTLANPFPAGFREPVGSSAGLTAQLGDSLSFFDQGRVSPYNQQWQVSVQRELPSQAVFEIAYLGMLSLKQLESFNWNEKPDRFLPLGAAENTRLPNPFRSVFPPTSPLAQSSTIVQRQLWLTFPQFTTLTVQGANTGRAVYHALQMRVDKRLTRGLNFVWHYTVSKLMDNNTTSIVNERHYRSISEFDQPQVMRLAFTYDLPFGPRRWLLSGTRGVFGKILEGWAVSGMLNLASGAPLTVTQANGRPLRIASPRKSGPVSERLGDRVDPATRQVLNPYFNVDAFAPLPTQYMVSPEPPRLVELREPGSRSLSLSAFKNLSLWERAQVQFRADAFSVTNTPNFNAPGTNMNNRALFGVITGAGGARSMQMSLKLIF